MLIFIQRQEIKPNQTYTYLGEDTFATPVCEIHSREITIYELWRKGTLELLILENKNGSQKANLSRNQNMAKLANLNTWVIRQKYLSKVFI